MGTDTGSDVGADTGPSAGSVNQAHLVLVTLYFRFIISENTKLAKTSVPLVFVLVSVGIGRSTQPRCRDRCIPYQYHILFSIRQIVLSDLDQQMAVS